MKKKLEIGQDKIKRICEILKNETLDPARQEAESLVKSAHEKADQILLEAKQTAKKLIEDSRQAIEQERNVFHSSLAQASKHSLEALKHLIEHKLFNETVEETVTRESSDPQLIAKLLNAIVEGITNEGVSKDFAAILPKNSNAEEIARHLTSTVIEQLKKNPISIGSFEGGAQVKLVDKKLSLVITNKEIAEFLKQYVRKDFRKFIFCSQHENTKRHVDS